MNVHNKRLFGFGMLLALVGGTPVALADVVDNSFNSVSTWAAEGNVRCSDYFSNNVVLEMNTSSVLDGNGATETLSGADDPLDADLLAEEVTYWVTDTVGDDPNGAPTELRFSSPTSTKINAVIIKRGRTVNFYSEPSGGVISDRTLDLDTGVAGDGVELDIAAISFCYGVPGEDPEAVVPLDACPTANANGETYCMDNNEKAECNVVNGQLECCACGNVTVSCLIELPSGEEGSCADTNINIESLTPAFTGTGSDIICYKVKKRLTCYEIN